MRSASRTRRPGTIRFVELDEAKRALPPVYDAMRPLRPGFFDRSPAFWESEFFADPEHWRRGASAAFHVVHEVAGVADGYARYRVRDDWDSAGIEVGGRGRRGDGDEPGGAPRPVALPHRHRPDGPHRDVEPRRRRPAAAQPGRAASAAGGHRRRAVDPDRRRRAGPGRSALRGRRPRRVRGRRRVLRVERRRLGAVRRERGARSSSRPSDAADLACDITDIGAVYLGAFGFRQLADAGRVRELDPGAIARADALFRTERRRGARRSSDAQSSGYDSVAAAVSAPAPGAGPVSAVCRGRTTRHLGGRLRCLASAARGCGSRTR